MRSRFLELLPWLPSLLCFVVLLCLVVVSLPVATWCADSSGASDPRVQQLYREAKQAEAQGDQATAIARYESIVRIAPKLGAAYNNLGMLYIRAGAYGKAIDILQQGLRVDPKMPSASALLGMSYFEMGKYEEARSPLEAALRADPHDNHAELMLAKTLLNLHDLQSAASHLEQLSKRQPQNSEVFYLLGQVHMQLSQEALAHLTAIDPNSVYVHEVSGDIMAGMKNFDGALIEYKKAVQMAPQQAGTHYKLGDAYWNLSDWNSATQEFQAELVNDSTNCMARWKLGNILLQQHQQPATALEDIDKALELCPKLMQARVDRAKALVMLDRNQEAVPELISAEKADPAEPSIHFLLGQAYRALGKSQEAQEEMKIFGNLEQSARAAAAEHAQQVLQNKSSSQ